MSALGTFDMRLHPDALLALADHAAAMREHAGALNRFAAALEAQAAPAPAAARAPVVVPATPLPPAAVSAPTEHWATAARKELLRRLVPAGENWHAIRDVIAACDGPPVPDPSVVKTYAFATMGLRRDPEKLRPIDRQRLERLAAGKAAQLGEAAPSGGPIADALAAAVPKPDRTAPVAPEPAASKPAPQPISRAEALARVGAIRTWTAPHGTGSFEPIEADLDQVRTWAAQRGLQVRDWEDLPAVNRKCEQLGLPTFKRRLPGRSVHQAGVGS